LTVALKLKSGLKKPARSLQVELNSSTPAISHGLPSLGEIQGCVTVNWSSVISQI